MKEYLEKAIYDIFEEMFKITEGVENPIFFDSAVTLTDGITVTASGEMIKDNAAFNANVLPNIDKKIENCIRYYVLAEWYVSVGLGDDATLNYSKYKDYLRQVKNLTFQLQKPLMS